MRTRHGLNPLRQSTSDRLYTPKDIKSCRLYLDKKESSSITRIQLHNETDGRSHYFSHEVPEENSMDI